MKELKITQCHIGRYNLLSNEESFSFSAAIYEDGKIIEENGLSAHLHYSSDNDESEDFKDIHNLDFIYEKCFEYAGKIMSSVDYMGNCLFFGKVYQDNFDEISDNLLAKQNAEIQKKIEALQAKLKRTVGSPDLSDNINYAIETQVKAFKKMVEYYDKEISDLKEGSEKYIQQVGYRDRYLAKIDRLQSYLIPVIGI